MAEALAYVSATHQDPPSTATTGFHLVVQYDGKDTLLYVPLKEPLAAHQPHEEAIAAEFRELAAALLRIAENPKAILPRDPARG